MKRNALIFLTLCAILIIGFNSRTPAQTILTGGGYTGPTTQTNLTGTRLTGTPYQNTGTTPIWVNYSFTQKTAASIAFTNSTNSFTDPANLVAICETPFATAIWCPISFIVLPQWWYKITISTPPSQELWVEWN